MLYIKIIVDADSLTATQVRFPIPLPSLDPVISHTALDQHEGQ